MQGDLKCIFNHWRKLVSSTCAVVDVSGLENLEISCYAKAISNKNRIDHIG